MKRLAVAVCSKRLPRLPASVSTIFNCARKTFPHATWKFSPAKILALRTGNQKLKTGFLINSRTDIALASGADGVHLRSVDISPAEVRRIWTQCGAGALARVTVGVSCHTPAEVAQAAAQGADFAVFGPVFEKKSARCPAGLNALARGLPGENSGARSRRRHIGKCGILHRVRRGGDRRNPSVPGK